jgi:hypothetical protein
LSSKLYAAIKTALISFATLFAVSLAGWLTDVMEWAGDTTGDFPSVSPLGKAAVAALAAALIGLVNYLVNLGQEHNVVPGKAPVYPNKTPEV